MNCLLTHGPWWQWQSCIEQELDGGSVEAESNFEILRAQRAQARKGVKQFKASEHAQRMRLTEKLDVFADQSRQDIRENEGVDEDDPLNSIDDGIRLALTSLRPLGALASSRRISAHMKIGCS